MEIEQYINCIVQADQLLAANTDFSLSDRAILLAQILQERAKDNRIAKMRARKLQEKTKATEKQKAYMDSLEIEYSDNITKQAASEKIENKVKTNEN